MPLPKPLQLLFETPLDELTGPSVKRYQYMDRCESYFSGHQDVSRPYRWDGTLIDNDNGGGPSTFWEARFQGGGAPPYSSRRPSVVYPLPRIVVRAINAKMFDGDRFPPIDSPGDPRTGDWIEAVLEDCDILQEMVEAREVGGSTGSSVLSWGLVEGKVRVKCHNPKHVTVIEWEDQDKLVLGAVFKAFSAPDDRPWTEGDDNLWSIRYWDSEVEIHWDGIKDEYQDEWWKIPPTEIYNHGFGFTPVYWFKNTRSGEDYDGDPDYPPDLHGTFDQINSLLSAAAAGSVANVDPTLVIKDDMKANEGAIRKGSGNAIYSPGGAEYLELSGTAVSAALDLTKDLKKIVLDSCGVVLHDPERVSGNAQSGKAMEILNEPTINTAKARRKQYGPVYKRFFLDLLKVARANPGDIIVPDGEEKSDDGEVMAVVHHPGTAEKIKIMWPKAFSATPEDISAMSGAVVSGNGGKPAMSQYTSVSLLAPVTGVESVDEEMERLAGEREDAQKQAMDLMEKKGGGGDGGEDGGEDGKDGGGDGKDGGGDGKDGGGAVPAGKK